MYGLAGYKSTPGMPDMNSRIQKLSTSKIPKQLKDKGQKRGKEK